MEYILENVVSDSLYSFKKELYHRHSPGIFPEQSKSKSSYTQVVIKLPRKNVESFSAWKRYVGSLMHLRFLELLKHFQNGKITLETL